MPRHRREAPPDAGAISPDSRRAEARRVVILPALDLASGRVASAREGSRALVALDADPSDLALGLIAAGAPGLPVVALSTSRTPDYRNLPLIATTPRTAYVLVQLSS